MQLYTKILLGMGVGVILGIFAGPNSFLLPHTAAVLNADAVVFVAPDGQDPHTLATPRQMRIIGEQPGARSEDPPWLQVEWTLNAAELLKLNDDGVEEAATLEAGSRHTGWVAETRPEVKRHSPVGITLVRSTEWVGKLFLALIKMVVIPLVFFSLLVGVASLGDFRKLGRIGLRTILFFSGTTAMALIIGVGLTSIVRPGHLLTDEARADLLASYSSEAKDKVSAAAEAPTMMDQLIGIVPANPVEALASGNMLQIIFFALMLGIALTYMDSQRARLVVDVSERINEAMVMLVHLIMKLAPYGVAALLFKVVGSTGPSVLMALGVYGLVVLAGLATHLCLTYGLVIRLGARLPFWGFLRAMRPAMLLGFSTSSSSATLPVTMECAEDNVGVSRQVTSFVLPLGATVNMDGTALYQGVAAVFIAQIYGHDLGLVAQATIVLSATLASVGAAGVPGAGMITLAMVLTAVGIPLEGLALILGIDRLLDMFRTSTNIVGDSTATVLMARLEGEQLHLLTPAEDRADPERGFSGRLDRDDDGGE